MGKFKVGQGVVIQHGYGLEGKKGFVTEVLREACMVASHSGLPEHHANSGRSEFHLCFGFEGILPYFNKTLTVGERYKSKNGQEWECIFVRDGKAWMLCVGNDGRAYSSAWQFNIDGTSDRSGLGEEWEIVFEPIRETVVTKGSWAKKRSTASQPLSLRHHVRPHRRRPRLVNRKGHAMRLICAYITVGLLRLAALLATTHVARSSLKLAADIEWDMRRG